MAGRLVRASYALTGKLPPAMVIYNSTVSLTNNSTLDVFYLTQLAAAIYRYSSQLDGDFPTFSDFPVFYSAHHALLHSYA